MPRRVYSKRTIVVRPKKRWASIMKSTSYGTNLTSGQSNQVNSHDLVVNSTDSATPTPIVVKTGNFKLYGTTNTSIASTDIYKLYNVTAYVMYCPQGYTYTTLLDITNHPEYIMGRSTFRFVPGENCSCSLSSRLKRNLNSGDKVCLVLHTAKDSALTGTLNIYLNWQYYTCAN